MTPTASRAGSAMEAGAHGTKPPKRSSQSRTAQTKITLHPMMSTEIYCSRPPHYTGVCADWPGDLPICRTHFPDSLAQAARRRPPRFGRRSSHQDPKCPISAGMLSQSQMCRRPIRSCMIWWTNHSTPCAAASSLETGWDALASLENAFIPLTTSLDPVLKKIGCTQAALSPSTRSWLTQAGW